MASYKRWYDAATRETGQRARQAEDEYYNRATAYDPHESVRRSAEGAWGALAPELDKAVKRLRGQHVGMGRIDTGFATEDEDELVETGFRDLGNEILRNSMAAEGLALENLQGLGSYGRSLGGDYLDLVAGGRDAEIAEAAAKRQRKGGLLGAGGAILGAAAGSFIPGVGTMLGAQLGGLLGNAAGRYL